MDHRDNGDVVVDNEEEEYNPEGEGEDEGEILSLRR